MSLTPSEIRSTYEDCSLDEAYECFDADGLTPEQVEAVLGEDAAEGFGRWMYLNVK